jgi:hypothetical protein
MKPIFRPTTAQDAPQLISFLARTFSVNPQSEFLRADLLHWKLWSPREDYTGSRSYVLERNGEIIAHSGIWPMTLHTPTGVLQGCHMFDWASDPHVLGSGVALLRKLSEMFDFLFGNAGSYMTQRIIPSIGFRKVGEAWSAARPLRPLRQMLTHQHLDWKIPARLVRNTIWSLYPRGAPPKGWALQEGIGQDEVCQRLSGIPPCSFRSNGFFRYLQNCPTAQVKVFQVQRDDRAVGKIALSLLHHQVRIAGVWLNHPSPEGLRATYELALQAARAMAPAFEIVASGSTAIREHAAVSAGLKTRSRTPIYWLFGKTGLSPVPFEFQLADNDAVFWSCGAPLYWL